MNIEVIVMLVWIHFFGDFILQNDMMALNKSKDNFWLIVHCVLYSLPLLFISFPFALANGLAHFTVDYVTSRITSSLWKRNERHWFFTMIGADQAIHLTVLFVSYSYLVQ